MENDKQYSPMMQHYLSMKDNYKDCILFYRLGDFYEMFFEDAVLVSKVLDLTLTGKDCGLKERAPMCGIPFHAADEYIAKLVQKGYKVAVCEQLSEPTGNSRELVKRDVIRIVTAGTITENTLLDDKSNNFASCISEVGGKFSASWVDITTGDFFVKEFEKEVSLNEVIEHLVKISPAEIISTQSIFLASKNNDYIKHGILPRIAIYKEWAFNTVHAEKTLLNHFNVVNLFGFGIENNQPIISACGALLEYLSETQKHAFQNITNLTVVDDKDYMILDGPAFRNLEITKTMREGGRYGSLLWLMDKTETAMGSRKLNEWLTTPLLNVEKINYRQDGVEELYNNPLMRNGIKEVLSTIADTERLAGKIVNGNVSPRDCLALGKSFSAFPSLKFTLAGAKSKIINDIANNIADLSDVASLLIHAISDPAPMVVKDGKSIKEGFDKEFDRLSNLSKNVNDEVKRIEAREREATGIKTLKVSHNKVFGYYIEVTNSFKEQVPYTYIRRQTLVGAERYITEELKNLEDEILSASDKLSELENQIFENITKVLLENVKAILRSSKAIATLDILCSFAILAKKNDYVRPNILNYGENLQIVGGRHPVVEEVSSSNFVPNDTVLDSYDNRMMIITGPNMAGKSTYMRQVALITVMAHVGSFVPAKSANIPLTDRIFTRVGASDNLIFDQSTFMVEMNEVAVILRKATENSLLILDEVGRGTSTFDGLSIAWSVVDYISNKIKAKTLFATHYHELGELEGTLEGVKNYKITVKELNGSIIFLRKIKEGATNKSFGIEVASLAGVPKEVTDYAKKILNKLEKNDLNKNNVISNEEELEEISNNDNEIIKELQNIDVDSLSPRDALDVLYELKKKIGK